MLPGGSAVRLLPLAALALAAALAPAAAWAAPAELAATLTGAQETKGGDPDGVGHFTVEIDPATNDFCYALWTDKIAKPTMAHVHEGVAGADGPVLFAIMVTGKNGDMCIAIDQAKLEPIVARPDAYYVNVHTADFPAGAVRAQLAPK